GPIGTGLRSGLGGHADRVEGGLEASDRAIDVAELVEAEQPDAERREVLGFAALQGHSGRNLHPGFLEARSVASCGLSVWTTTTLGEANSGEATEGSPRSAKTARTRSPSSF